jgi:pimeloyl-ACP methyl ester carboxylesterase
MLDGRTFANLESLRNRWRLIAYDFPESSMVYRGELDDFTQCINDFCRVMNIDSADLMGVSFGGVPAIRLAADTNATLRVTSLFLASTRIVGSTKDARKQQQRNYRFTSSLEDYQYYWLVEKLLNRTLRSLSEQNRERIEPLFTVKKLDYYRQVSHALHEYNGRDDAQKVHCPVLLLQGEEDELFSPEEQKEVISYFEHSPRVRLEMVEDADHTMVYLHGGQVADHITRFAAETSLSTSR